MLCYNPNPCREIPISLSPRCRATSDIIGTIAHAMGQGIQEQYGTRLITTHYTWDMCKLRADPNEIAIQAVIIIWDATMYKRGVVDNGPAIVATIRLYDIHLHLMLNERLLLRAEYADPTLWDLLTARLDELLRARDTKISGTGDEYRYHLGS